MGSPFPAILVVVLTFATSVLCIGRTVITDATPLNYTGVGIS
jgi:hypothetical protein